MRETHVPLESVWERLVRAVEEGSKRSSKSLKGSKLGRTLNLTYSKSTKNTFTHSEQIKVHLPTVKGKQNGLTFTECSVKVCRFLLLSPPYWKWSYHNATQSECAHRLRRRKTTVQWKEYLDSAMRKRTENVGSSVRKAWVNVCKMPRFPWSKSSFSVRWTPVFFAA